MEILRKAARDGDYQLAKRLLKSKQNQVDQVTLLQACRSKNEKLMKLLLAHVDRQSSLTRSDTLPLQIACSDGSLSIVKTLLNHGYSVTKECFECFRGAVLSDVSLPVVLFLIAEHGVTFIEADDQCFQQLYAKPLQQAFEQHDVEAMMCLLAFGAKMKPKAIVLQHAVTSNCDMLLECILTKQQRKKTVAIMDLLVDHGYPITHQAACAAVRSNDEGLVNLLLSQDIAPFLTCDEKGEYKDGEKERLLDLLRLVDESKPHNRYQCRKETKSAILLAAELKRFDFVETIVKYVKYGTSIAKPVSLNILASKDYQVIKRFLDLVPSIIQYADDAIFERAIQNGWLHIVKLCFEHKIKLSKERIEIAGYEAFGRGHDQVVTYLIRHEIVTFEELFGNYWTEYEKEEDQKRMMSISAELALTNFKRLTSSNINVNLMKLSDDYDIDIRDVSTYSLMKCILKDNKPDLFRQTLACGHPFCADLSKKMKPTWNFQNDFPNLGGFFFRYIDIFRLKYLPKNDDVAHAIVNCVADGSIFSIQCTSQMKDENGVFVEAIEF